MKLASRLWLYFILNIPLLSLAQGGKELAQFKLPATNRTGLVDIFIEYEPVFRIDQFETSASVLLNMNVKLSRANDVKGNFWYRYWYEGEQYTDQQLGKDVFAPIDLDYLGLVVTIMGPDALIQTVTWTNAMRDQIVVRIPGKHKSSEFKVFIKGLESVSFKGDGPIKKAIIDLRTAQRKKAEDEKKAADDKIAVDKKAADEKQKADNLKKAQAFNSTQNAAGTTRSNTTTGSSTSKDADDNFWGDKKPAPATSIANMPDLVMSNTGKYYRKGADGKPQEKSYNEYQRLKRERAALQQKTTPTIDPAAKQEADQKALNATMAKIKKDQADNDAMWKDIDRKIDLNNQAFQAADAREEAKQNLKDVTRLSGNYASVDQLMEDFNNRMAQLNGAMNDLTEKRNAAVNAAVDANYNAPGDEAYAETFKAVGGFVNMMKADKEKKRAQAELKAQKEAMLRNMEAEEKRMLTSMRTDLFLHFKEGGLPLSSTRLEANTVYYFVYAYDPAQQGAKNPTLYVSNVFSVSRYSDGTWPFKTSITNDIGKLTPYTEVLHGYYMNQGEAEAMQRGLKDVFARSGGRIIPFTYKGKKTATTTSGGKVDFWETGKKATTDSTSKEKKPKEKDNFWNN